MIINWTTVYKAYPVNKEMIWLNNCGTTPAGKHIVKALSRFIEGYAQKGVLTKIAVYPEVQNSIKKILSNLLHGFIRMEMVIGTFGDGHFLCCKRKAFRA